MQNAPTNFTVTHVSRQSRSESQAARLNPFRVDEPGYLASLDNDGSRFGADAPRQLNERKWVLVRGRFAAAPANGSFHAELISGLLEGEAPEPGEVIPQGCFFVDGTDVSYFLYAPEDKPEPAVEAEIVAWLERHHPVDEETDR
jgi:hypothetical protein